MRALLVSQLLPLGIVFGQTPKPLPAPAAVIMSDQDRARSLIEDSLRDKNPDTRKVLLALRNALIDNDWSVRAAAAHAIAVRNDPALEKDLLPLFDDKKEAVRVRAAAGYLRLESINSTRPKLAQNRNAKP